MISNPKNHNECVFDNLGYGFCARHLFVLLLSCQLFVGFAWAGPAVDAQKKLDQAHYDFQRKLRQLPANAPLAEKKKLHRETIGRATYLKNRASEKNQRSLSQSMKSILESASQEPTLDQSKASISSVSPIKKTNPATSGQSKRPKVQLDGSKIEKTVTF